MLPEYGIGGQADEACFRQFNLPVLTARGSKQDEEDGGGTGLVWIRGLRTEVTVDCYWHNIVSIFGIVAIGIYRELRRLALGTQLSLDPLKLGLVSPQLTA